MNIKYMYKTDMLPIRNTNKMNQLNKKYLAIWK